MAFSATLATATDRIRLALGDTGATSIMPGGEAVYTSLLAASPLDEGAVYRVAASVLANYYASQPSSVGSSGESVSWGPRVEHWRLVATGRIPYPFSADGTAIDASGFAAGLIGISSQETNV